MVRKISIVFASLFSIILFLIGIQPFISGNIGGCSDTTITFGWPLKVYVTSGIETMCRNGLQIPAKFYFIGLILDVYFYGFLLYTILLCLKKIKQSRIQ